MTDRATYAARFTERARQAPGRPKHRYLARLDSILRIQEYVVADSTARQIPVIETDGVDDVTSMAAGVIGDHLEKQQARRKSAADANGKKHRKT